MEESILTFLAFYPIRLVFNVIAYEIVWIRGIKKAGDDLKATDRNNAAINRILYNETFNILFVFLTKSPYEET